MAVRTIQDPPFARFLFDNTSSAWIWLLARLYLGWQWLQAGWHKVTDPAWMNGGTALQGFWAR
ncbi:MAG: DoxX family protein, partial [Symbiobacterium thermophilum]|nr:DoxX family protein [Symbiobacterium thermophilum]